MLTIQNMLGESKSKPKQYWLENQASLQYKITEYMQESKDIGDL